MASLMEDLLEALEQEELLYQELIELGDVKKEAIIQADIGKLGETTSREQDVAGSLLNLSNKRTQVLNDMAAVLGKDPEKMTVNRMIDYLEKQPAEQEKLIRKRERLLEVGIQMRLVNQQNEALLKQALEMAEFDLTLLRSMRQAPETANYDKNAYNTGDLLGSNGFDARQ